jgi:hypothetical protein
MIKQAMFQPAFRGAQDSKSTSVPAPLRGWNARDGKANMNPLDAIILENWFPKSTSVDIRPGCEDYATGLPGVTYTLLAYSGVDTQEFFAVSEAGIYDITTSGAVGAPVTTVTNPQMQYVNFNTLGGSYLIAVNGSDELKLYDGATWEDIDGSSTPAITGLATTSLSNVTVFKRRLWFTEKDSMSAWYLPVNQIGGALTEFPVGQLFIRGGYLVGIATWTIDGGIGIDDHLVFLSSEGEAAVYKGSDPASATDFSLVGVYYVGKPVGDRCLTKYGGDVLILCETGIVALSKMIASTNVNFSGSLSDRINGAFAEAVQFYQTNYGWECTVFPGANLLLVNVPVTVGGRSDQFCMNTLTNAWCRFTGWNATTWCVWNGELYFSTSTKVVKAWTGTSDYGNNIVASAKPAFNYFSQRARQKHFKLVRPILEIDKQASLQLGLDVDFEDDPQYGTVTLGSPAISLWDTALWDSGIWSGGSEVEREWRTVLAQVGYCAALRLRISTKSATVSWSATDYVYKQGGVL